MEATFWNLHQLSLVVQDSSLFLMLVRKFVIHLTPFTSLANNEIIYEIKSLDVIRHHCFTRQMVVSTLVRKVK